MKKIFLLISFLTLSLNLFSEAVLADTKTRIPVINPGFGFSYTAMVLQPGANNLQYAIYTQPLPITAPHWVQQSVEPDYQYAFDAGLQYTFDTRMDQVKLDWLHLRTEDKASAYATGSASVAPIYYFGPLAQALFRSTADAQVKFDFDSITFIFDRLFNWGRFIQIGPFIGLNATYLKQDIEAAYAGVNSSDDPYSITAFNTSKLYGIGPRLGLDVSGYLLKNFSLNIEMGTSILIGSIASNTHFLSTGVNNPSPVSTSLSEQTLTRIVPEIDSKVGLMYELIFRPGSCISLEAGYKFATYIDGINQIVPTALVLDQLNNGVLAIETSSQTQSNFDLNGPFLKLTCRY